MVVIGLLVFIEILLPVVFIQNIAQGPTKGLGRHYMNEDRCKVTEIRNIHNFCPTGQEDDIAIGFYEPNWEPCVLIEIASLATSLQINCSHILLTSYSTEIIANVSHNEFYEVGDEYDCVVDTLNLKCYENQHELSVSILAISGNTLVLVGISVIFCVVSRKIDQMYEKREQDTV